MSAADMLDDALDPPEQPAYEQVARGRWVLNGPADERYLVDEEDAS